MSVEINPPQTEIGEFLKQWTTLEKETAQENSLKKLFSETYTQNDTLDEVLVKVRSLDDFYGTNISSPITIAKHIVSQDIDGALAKGSVRIVNVIANVRMDNGENRNFYSFATKYCSHHNPSEYPIYDSSVEKILVYFRNKDKFYDFSRQNLKEYPLYKNILVSFRKHYGLEEYDLQQISQYLWQAGKKYFPKSPSSNRDTTKEIPHA